MKILSSAMKSEKEYASLLLELQKQQTNRVKLPIMVSGLCDGSQEIFISSISEDLKTKSIVITRDEKSAEKICKSLMGLNKTLFFPLRDFIFEEMDTATNTYEVMRMQVLHSIINNDFDVIVTTLDAALQLTIPKEKLFDFTIRLETGKNIKSCTGLDSKSFISKLVESGYKRCDMVEGVSSFSVRGDIIDIFSPSMDYPVRIEFFGDEIDSMGIFNVLTQRRIENIKTFDIIPVSEVIIGNNPDVQKDLISLIQKLVKNKRIDERTRDKFYREIDALSNGETIKTKDRYIREIYKNYSQTGTCLFDYFNTDETAMFLINAREITDRAKAHEALSNENIKDIIEKGYIDGNNAVYEKHLNDFAVYQSKFLTIMTDIFLNSRGSLLFDGKYAGIYTFTTKQTTSISLNFETFCDDLKFYCKNKYKIIVAQNTDSGIQNLKSTLFDFEIDCYVANYEKYETAYDIPPGIVVLIKNDSAIENSQNQSEKNPHQNTGMGNMSGIAGFELVHSKFVFISDRDTMRKSQLQEVRRNIITRVHGKNQKKHKSGQKIEAFTDLSVGDIVVHVNYGIGIFMGIVREEISGGARKDFIKIKYAGTDILFVPCTQLDMVSKYIGAGEERSVKLSKMGGVEWHRAKAKVKAAAREIADKLIKLYAARQMQKGFTFSEDTEWQRDFEAVFEYDETEDQLMCTEEIKEDMQKSMPMDRLLCGDVGFGKTEVALRAAFKCVSDSKQVAILVPTTILAWQHYKTIISRFREFPVKIDFISRFKSTKEKKETLRKLEKGETDIIVGTHRLVQKDIKFKNLGLLVIDEEQRFGVAHKERLKELSGNIDVLTLTATPIPRTLNMALTGIRDMSVIEEAPQDRLPVQTYIFEHDLNILAEGIKKELKREGQVFYLHNRVESIASTAEKIQALVPEARIGIGHGKMSQEDLSEVWRQMVEGKIDILVCTTIIETGIDVPNANTLIIENAERMGLAQLHQIRGRVGRSSRKAYAYLTYPSGKSLSEIATKRLMAIREYSEFGSGFKIAMRDLEIRGAGNLLGAEQHGQMEAVGYDLYVKILNQAVYEEKKKQEYKEKYGLNEPDSDEYVSIDGKKKGQHINSPNNISIVPKVEGENIRPEKTECVVDIAVDAFISQRYIESEIIRIDIYKKIAAIENDEDASDLIDELSDRFGDIPKPILNLIDISLIRNTASLKLIDAIENKDKKSIIIKISALTKEYAKDLLEKITLAAGTQKLKGKLMLTMNSKPYVTLILSKGEGVIDLIKLFLSMI